MKSLPRSRDGVHAAACLDRLLTALNWTDGRAPIIRALPHEEPHLDGIDVRNVLAELGWPASRLRARSLLREPAIYPVLLETRDGRLIVLLGTDDVGVRAFDPTLGDVRLPIGRLPDGRMWTFLARPPLGPAGTTVAQPWWRPILVRFLPSCGVLLAMGFLGLVAALVVPLCTLLVFDVVLPAADLRLLLGMLAGAVVLIAIELGQSMLRARVHARMSARLGRIVAVAVFRHLHELPAAALESAPIRQQVAKLRQFDQVRDLLGEPVLGTVVGAVTSLPLWIVLIVALGWPVLLPLCVMVLASAAAVAHLRPLDAAVSRAAAIGERRDGHVDEFVREAPALRLLGAGHRWLARIRVAVAGCAEAGISVARLQRRLQLLGATATQVAGYGTLFLLAHSVLGGGLSPGLMMAGTFLTWRVLAPWQQAMVQLPRFVRLRRELGLLDQFMRMPSEAEQRPPAPLPRRHAGALRFDNVGLVYAPGQSPALLGVTFEARPGEFLGIQGPSGAGKSTLLKTALGMLQPQVGRVLLDGVDTRQMNPQELRSTFAYLPQRLNLYTGTIEQNLRLGSIDATARELEEACDRAGLLEELRSLPAGFATRLQDLPADGLSEGFVQRLCLARTYLRRAPVVLLDEPGRALDEAADRRLREWLAASRGRRTILVVTPRPSHLAQANRVIRLEAGRLADPPNLPPAAPAGADRARVGIAA